MLAALDKWIQVAERARDWWLDRVVEHYWAHSDVASNPDPDPQVQAAKLREAKKYLEDATRKYENYIKKIEKLEKKKKRVKEQAERRRAERRRYQ